MAEADVIYMAGFFDGEGCITVNKNVTSHCRVARYQLKIQVSQKAREPLECFVDMWDGAIHPQLDIFCWHAGSLAAKKALEDMLPYLRGKKEQAIAAIEFQSTKKYGRYKDSERESILKMNEEYYLLLKRLKVA
jgi:hypothetical protein